MITFLVLLVLSLPAFSLEISKSHLVNGCTLINWNGQKEKVFPGSFCQFFEDGSFLSGSLDSLKYIDKDSSIKWEYKGHIHHQVNLSNDLQKVLVLSSDNVQKDGKNIRIDRFVILSKEGKVLFSENSEGLMKQVNRKPFTPVELTHFNSFYEIPDIKVPAPSYIKKGNFVANSNRVGVFILSPDLKRVLHFKRIPTSFDHQVHDVQILPNGHMIYFNNSHLYTEGKTFFSTVEELDLNHDKLVFEFRSNPESAFYSLHCGGVQKIDDDTVLFSHMLTGTYLYSISNKKILRYIYQTHIQEFYKFYPTQQVKVMDLSAFLSHWK